VATYFVAPLILSDFWLCVSPTPASARSAPSALNLLTATAARSAGHAAFIGVGAYVAGWLGHGNTACRCRCGSLARR